MNNEVTTAQAYSALETLDSLDDWAMLRLKAYGTLLKYIQQSEQNIALLQLKEHQEDEEQRVAMLSKKQYNMSLVHVPEWPQVFSEH